MYKPNKLKSNPKPIKQEKKKKKKIRFLSIKREAMNKIYIQKRKVFLEANPSCQMKLLDCTYNATDVHHSVGRVGELLTDETKFIAACRSCHSKHHNK